MFNKTEKYIIAGVVSAVIAIILAFNCYTVVGSGTVKVKRLFGKVDQQELTEGFYLVNPMADFVTFNVKEQAYELSDVGIPTKDKFTSSANITVMYQQSGSSTPKLLSTVGREDEVEHKIIRQPLLSLIREAGRGVEKSQDLFNESTQNKIQEFLLTEMRKATEAYGITINAVYIQNISLPTVIMNSITTTKRLEEQEAQERAKLNQQALVFERQVKEAESNAKAAEQKKIAEKHRADAIFYAKQKEADAKLYLAKKEALANKELAKSVTQNLLNLKDKEIALKQAEQWKGDVPTTVLGDSPIPLWNVNK